MDSAKTPFQENKMGTMPVGRLLSGMAIPMMISMLVQALYNVVDSIFVSHISAVDDNALNAVSLAFPLQSLMIAFAGGTAMGMNALLSRSLGEKKQERADRAACTGIFLIFCNALLFALIGGFFAKPFFAMQTGTEAVVRYGTSYVRICLIGSIGLFSQFCFERLLQATGRTTWTMITQMTGAVINLILDPILIFGLFGFPRMEVAGAAAATITGQIVAAIMALIINLKRNPDIHIRLRYIRWDSRIVGKIYKIGLPSIVMQAIGSVMIFTLNQILLTFHEIGESATAVFGIYFKLQSFVFMPIFGLNNAMVPIIAYNYGARQHDRVKKTIRLAMIGAEALMLIGVILFETAPEILLGFFSPTENAVTLGISALRIIASHFLLAGVSIVSISVCQAIGNPVHALIVSVCRQLVVLLPVAWLLSRTGLLWTVWLAFPIAEFVSMVLCLIFLRGTLKKAKEHALSAL